MKKVLIACMGVLAVAAQAVAADAAKGKEKATTVCAACHGANGISAADTFPNLAGQKAGYMEAQLKAFKSGERKNPVMSPIASGLSDEDIQNVSAYFSSLGTK